LSVPEAPPQEVDGFDDFEGDNDDGEAPEEISFKKPDIAFVTDTGEEKTFYEKITDEQNMKKKKQRNRRKDVKQIDEAQFEVKQGRAMFKVVNLSKPLSAKDSTINFKENLLRQRTEDRRMTRSAAKGLVHQRRWIPSL